MTDNIEKDNEEQQEDGEMEETSDYEHEQQEDGDQEAEETDQPQESEDESSSIIEVVDNNEIEQQMNHRIKSIKRTIPLPIITHPSHIPRWRPEHQVRNSQIQGSKEDDKIIDFNPIPLTITQTREETLVAPELTVKLRKFWTMTSKPLLSMKEVCLIIILPVMSTTI